MKVTSGAFAREAEAVECSSVPLLAPQLGGFRFCVADLKQEFKYLPHDGTKKRRENNSRGSCMAGCTAVSSTDLAAQ